MAKKTSAKIIQISDILQWHEKGELELSPHYQRNSVWNEKAKSYLMDSIIRGLPIPPIFLRQKVDVITKSTFREIVDGQQRLRAIIEYVVEEKYAIKQSHNRTYGSKRYSDLDDDIKEAILEYEIIAEVVTEKDDTIIYDMFARLNSNNMVLNRQEIRNSKYWGDYKVYIYQMTSKYRGFFSKYEILYDTDFARMKDAEFISSLNIIITEGIVGESPTLIDNVYSKYDKDFNSMNDVEFKFESIMSVIDNVFSYLNGNVSCFQNKNYFYTLFSVILSQMFGIRGLELPRIGIFTSETIMINIDVFINQIVQFIHDYKIAIDDKDNTFGLYIEYSQFAKIHSIRTTSKAERIERIRFLNAQIGSDIDAN
jgi:hypothetical protein